MQPISDQEPTRTVVASHASYRSARQDADHLVLHGFPPDRVSVRVRELELVRLRLAVGTCLRRAGRWGLVVGAVGALLGLWVGRVVLALPVGVALAVSAGAAAAWAAAGLAGAVAAQEVRARLRGQTGVDVLQADGFDVAVDRRLAAAARRLLSAAHREPGGRDSSSTTPSNRPGSDPSPGAAADGDGTDRGP
jgi:hypothetical protein